MKNYYCKKCKYKTRKDSKPESCNYCGERGSMNEEHSAEEILNL